MEPKVFGISKVPRAGTVGHHYIVWEAPAPQDETEPEYVKPLVAAYGLPAAENALHNIEAAYAEQRAAAGTPEEPIIDTDEDFGSAVALP